MKDTAIFELEFNKDNFVTGVADAIKSAESLEQSLKGVTENAKSVSFSKPISEMAKFETSIKEVFNAMQKESKMTNAEIDKATKEILGSKKNITTFLNELKAKLKTTTNTQEFKDFANQITLTENALKELSGETVNLDEKNKSAKARLREMKQALIEMEDAGQDDTAMFHKLTMESAKLTDQLGDQSEKIRVLSSDTYKMDAGVDVIKQVANVWQLAEGSLALFGIQNEDVQKSLQKLMAIQAVANGLTEIQTFLTGQSAGMVLLKSGYNQILAYTEGLVATATGASTAATQAFSKALVGTGIGAFIVALGLLIANWRDVSDAINGTSDITRGYDDAIKDVSATEKDFNLNLQNVKNSIKEAKEGTISKKEALKQYNEKLGETIGYAGSLNQAEQLMAANTKIVIESLKPLNHLQNQFLTLGKYSQFVF
jgi:hypothetical protein